MRRMGLPCGSSPRARGTPQRCNYRVAHRRFIPASAGNTLRVRAVTLGLAVHPRERGEHGMAVSRASASAGSSPRARGTPRPSQSRCMQRRFIPASAGNTPALPAESRQRPVHPRERGEHPVSTTCAPCSCGSSPRARGTRTAVAALHQHQRFIPASAENTCGFHPSPAEPPVHPQERGEHAPARHPQTLEDGSSPRARGTLHDQSRDGYAQRFIPTSAGNTTYPGTTYGASSGSSPRARGTPRRCPPSCLATRFIPASAGNTSAVNACGGLMSVHPRERGEHVGVRCRPSSKAGSSPRARGTRGQRPAADALRQFIPASAGNTSAGSVGRSAGPVHPRERGEHIATLFDAGAGYGSSPRARGTPEGVARLALELRFIPASAGNTRNIAPSCCNTAVHPRERGEHRQRGRAGSGWHGSSPRARGTLPRRWHVAKQHRFIPASAGNTWLPGTYSTSL